MVDHYGYLDYDFKAFASKSDAIVECSRLLDNYEYNDLIYHTADKDNTEFIE